MPDKSCTFLLVKFNDGIGSFTFIIHRKRKENLFFASVQKKRQNESLLSFSSSTPKKKNENSNAKIKVRTRTRATHVELDATWKPHRKPECAPAKI